MPVHFADNWTISRTDDSSPIVLTFWLNVKVPPFVQNVTKKNRTGKKKSQELYQHKLTVHKLTLSSQIGGWIVNTGTNVFTFHLNRREYTQVNPKHNINENENDNDDDDDYVRIVKNYVQSEEEIKNVINPPPKPTIAVVEIPEEQETQESWTAE